MNYGFQTVDFIFPLTKKHALKFEASEVERFAKDNTLLFSPDSIHTQTSAYRKILPQLEAKVVFLGKSS